MSEHKEKGDADHGSKYGKGFAFRMTILLGLLALVAAGLIYDRAVLAPQTTQKINDAVKLMQKDPGVEISKKEVEETIGFAAASTDQQDGYEIETYQFKRALPFAKGDYLSVIYEDGSLINILHNKPYSLDAAKIKVDWVAPENYTGNYPNVMGGGGAPGGGGDDEDEDEDEDDEDEDDEDEDDEDEDDEDDEDDSAASDGI